MSCGHSKAYCQTTPRGCCRDCGHTVEYDAVYRTLEAHDLSHELWRCSCGFECWRDVPGDGFAKLAATERAYTDHVTKAVLAALEVRVIPPANSGPEPMQGDGPSW